MNGREHIPDYNGGIPFELFREDNSNNNNYCHQDSLMGIHEGNNLNGAFFSTKNVNLLQRLIQDAVSNETQGKVTIGKQSEQQLAIIMRSVYLQHGRNLPEEIKPVKTQVDELNQKLLDYAVPNIITNVKQYIGFVNDVNAPPSLPIVPTSTRINNKTLLLNVGFNNYQQRKF